MDAAVRSIDRDGAAGRRRESPPSTTAAVAKFAAAGLAALAVLGVATFFLTRGIGNAEAVSDAKRVTRLVGTGIVEPELESGLLAGRPAAIARFDRLVSRRALRDPIVRTKIWTAGGRLVYSDEPALIGARYPLAADEQEVLRNGGVDAEVSDLTRPENRSERGQGKLLEVYLPIRGPDGQPLLFEAYQHVSTVEASADRIWLAFAPALIGALLLLELVQVPLATSMARRLRRGHEEREALLARSLEASNVERRRIAGDLHDGVVQRLAGTSFALSAAAERSGRNGDDDPTRALRQGAVETRQGIRELRSLLVEIYPPSLEKAGLEAALADLLAPVSGRGVEVRLDVDSPLDLPPEVESLFFRIAQEAIRNIVAHADAELVEVEVAVDGDRANLRVADDGRGFRVDEVADTPEEGHLGLRIIEEVAAGAGATVEIESSPGDGTRLSVEAPVAR